MSTSRTTARRSRSSGAALAVALVGLLATAGLVVPGRQQPAQAAPADLLPPAVGILPGPAPGGAVPGSWGPCVPDPDADDNCSGWLIPPGAIVEDFPGTDNAPNVIVGGDFTAGLGSAETEGLLVVAGDADFLRSYNVGVAGGGTGVVPAQRADMLVVGGDVTVANPSEDPNAGGNPANVGVGLTTTNGNSRYGDIHVGGTWNFRDPSFGATDTTYGILGNVDTANQDPPAFETQNVLDTDVSVLTTDGYTDLFGADGKMSRYSQQCYAELSTDTDATTISNEGGTLSLEHGTFAQVGNVVTLTSTGTADVVEFVLPATLGTSGSPVQINIVGASAGQTVLVNTLGTGPVTQFIGDVYWGAGVGDDLNARALEEGRRILWNYPFTTDLTLGGASQFPGSILVGDPASSTELGFSGANGRVYTPGDLLHTGTAAGTAGDELHDYPFDGALGCIRTIPGTFSVAKEITGDGAASVPDATVFTVGWEVTAPSDSPNLGRTGTVDVTVAGEPVLGPIDLAEGDEITFSEPTFPDVPGIDWGTPEITPNPITIGEEDSVVAVTVTNEAVLQRGGFTLTKDVTGDPGASTRFFDVTWTCDAPNLDGDTTGTINLIDDDLGTVYGFPVGTTCTFSEDTPTDDNGTWSTPVITPEDITIAEDDGTVQVVTVTNEFTVDRGGFTVAKETSGEPGSTVTEFTGTWTCDAANLDGDDSGTWALSDGQTLTLDGFPVGTTCSVTEDPITDANGTWTPTISPDSIVVTDGDPSATIFTVTNDFVHGRGGFEVVKEITGDGASLVPDDTTFTVDWEVTAPADSADLGRTGTLDLTADGAPATGPSDLLTGDQITFTEVTPPDVPGIDWGTVTVSPDPVTIGDGTTVSVTVTNEALLPRGGFTILKEVTGDDGASTTQFEVTWTCDAENLDGDTTGTVTLADGDEVVVTGFPVGTTCTFSETTPTDDNGTWAVPVIDPDQITIAEDDGTTPVVTVTNEFAVTPTPTPTPSPSTPTPTASETTPAPTITAPTPGPTATVPTPGPDLPRTGADVAGWALLALTLVGLGSVAVLAVRRRRA
ncbi:choice-of-anchor A domain-containing protein [Isoptericola jiangsuensis]|uniref:Choice-of-anchor A domain-containing protein n=1 Tax=Isoptericola jiangsuensis TaxID=548579 RepID=A0A2A9EW42_9MICO|nr:DUF5979 domain-containing protein [Isoptericola jiangsuensis]PFG43108.1 choice-of-anchor A domain-containing protein [Isoptericola jiangsuensis]